MHSIGIWICRNWWLLSIEMRLGVLAVLLVIYVLNRFFLFSKQTDTFNQRWNRRVCLCVCVCVICLTNECTNSRSIYRMMKPILIMSHALNKLKWHQQPGLWRTVNLNYNAQHRSTHSKNYFQVHRINHFGQLIFMGFFSRNELDTPLRWPTPNLIDVVTIFIMNRLKSICVK